jgi:hypothetical protein
MHDNHQKKVIQWHLAELEKANGVFTVLRAAFLQIEARRPAKPPKRWGTDPYHALPEGDEVPIIR